MSVKEYSTKGFSLLEMAIALVILGVLIISFNGVFKLVFETDHRFQQIYESKKVQDALETFLAVNSRLPCPDTDGDGLEDPNGQVCAASKGGLPYNDLGVKQKDAWGNNYFYQVVSSAADDTNLYTNKVCHTASVFGFTGSINSNNLKICSTTNKVVCDSSPSVGDCRVWITPLLWLPAPWLNASVNGDYAPYFTIYTPVTDSLTLTSEGGDIEDTGVVALAVSWGANGDRVNNSSCVSMDAEAENCDGDTTFVKTLTGLERDYVTPITLQQAQKAIVASRRFK